MDSLRILLENLVNNLRQDAMLTAIERDIMDNNERENEEFRQRMELRHNLTGIDVVDRDPYYFETTQRRSGLRISGFSYHRIKYYVLKMEDGNIEVFDANLLIAKQVPSKSEIFKKRSKLLKEGLLDESL